MSADTESEAKEALVGRELPSAINSERLLQEHRELMGTKVRTRFPPEPNGYLHIGHAKSMNMNFELAFEKLGVEAENRETIFRYDDTNPEAESKEYIDSLREDVDWLGWNPLKTTYTSDYFTILHSLAVRLITEGKAYVCHQTKADIEKSREIVKSKFADPNFEGDPNSPWRDRPVEESLKEFDNMRKGKYSSSGATLRLKMDMTSPNPNMWDQVAYRIKYVPHPHAGSDWCIYPTYDYTHCIIDSLEHIDYSICTLEFETRRESYFWVLEALDLYRPKVYEMSRLNISYTVLSKRRLLKLVDSGFMRGWDDPRMPTLKGLRRRGYTPNIVNAFIKDIGATRNANTVQYARLEAIARNQLHDTSPRIMVVVYPLKISLTNLQDVNLAAEGFDIQVPDYPFDPSRGSHAVPMRSEVYIDRSDFRMQDSEDYFGLAPGKHVSLKYGFRIKCDKVDTDANGEPQLLHCSCLPEGVDEAIKPKGTIHWVPAVSAVPIEVRMYGHLFNVEEPSDEWEKDLNRESEVVLQSFADPSVLNNNLSFLQSYQFERTGFFVVDKDTESNSTGSGSDSGSSSGSSRKIVFNLTVGLKESKPKDAYASAASGSGRSRKEEQAKAAAEKLARLSVAPEDMFKSQTDLYSQFDADGVPTHDNTGEKLSKSALKKLKKDWEKQKKLFETK
jgi:glutaminyl-tRNA synthetase